MLEDPVNEPRPDVSDERWDPDPSEGRPDEPDKLPVKDDVSKPDAVPVEREPSEPTPEPNDPRPLEPELPPSREPRS